MPAAFEYHCQQSHDSADAELWYRSHQRVTVLGLEEEGYGGTLEERGANGQPRAYLIRFADGHEATAFEDELLVDERGYTPDMGPPPAEEIQAAKALR